MSNLRFWHSIKIFNGTEINTYYLAENMTWLFAVSDIQRAIDNIINDDCNKICFFEKNILNTTFKKQLCYFQHDSWKTIDVLQKEDIFEITKSCSSDKAKEFSEWIEKLCVKLPEGCILSKESREYEFLNLAANRFLDLYEEINSETFMDLTSESRLYKIKEIFSVYAELLAYSSIKEEVDLIKKTRPPMESVIIGEFVKFIRNILIHFPFFTTWEEIYISRHLVNWAEEGRSIDRFLNKYKGHEDVEYRFKQAKTHKWRYTTIKFPSEYNDNKIFLKDMISEKDGVLLCVVLMYNVVISQIIDLSESN